MNDLDRILREALEREAQEKKEGGPSPEEMLKMAEALRKIREGEFDRKAEDKLNKTPIDRMVEDLIANRDVKRALKIKKVARPKVHWSKRRAAKRKYDRERYKEILRPMRKQALAERIQTAEGWWEVATKGWERHGIPVEMTEEEFKTVVFPCLCERDEAGSLRLARVPVFFRLDKGKGWRLDNLLVRDTESRKVLFDGNEYGLRLRGYIL